MVNYGYNGFHTVNFGYNSLNNYGFNVFNNGLNNGHALFVSEYIVVSLRTSLRIERHMSSLYNSFCA